MNPKIVNEIRGKKESIDQALAKYDAVSDPVLKHQLCIDEMQPLLLSTTERFYGAAKTYAEQVRSEMSAVLGRHSKPGHNLESHLADPRLITAEIQLDVSKVGSHSILPSDAPLALRAVSRVFGIILRGHEAPLTP